MKTTQVILQLPEQLIRLIDGFQKNSGHKTRNKAIESLIIKGLIQEEPQKNE